MRILGAFFGLFLAFSLQGQEATVGASEKRPLSHADYDRWESLKSYDMDGLGDLAFAIVAPQEGDGYMAVYQLATGEEIARIPRVSRAEWLPKTGMLLIKQDPAEAEMRPPQTEKKRRRTTFLPHRPTCCTLSPVAATGIARTDSLGAITRWGIQGGYEENDSVLDELILERPAKEKEKPHADFLTVLMDYEDLIDEATGAASVKFYPPVVDTLMAFDRVLDWGFPKEEQNLYATWYVITEHKDSKLAELHWDRPEIAETAVEFSNVAFAFNGIIYQKKDRKDQAYPSLWYRDVHPERRTPMLIAEYNSPGMPPGYGPYAGGRTHTY